MNNIDEMFNSFTIERNVWLSFSGEERQILRDFFRSYFFSFEMNYDVLKENLENDFE